MMDIREENQLQSYKQSHESERRHQSDRNNGRKKRATRENQYWQGLDGAGARSARRRVSVHGQRQQRVKRLKSAVATRLCDVICLHSYSSSLHIDTYENSELLNCCARRFHTVADTILRRTGNFYFRVFCVIKKSYCCCRKSVRKKGRRLDAR